METIHEKIRTEAARQLLSKKDIQEATGLSYPTVLKAFKGGSVSMSNMRKIVEFLGIQITKNN